LQASAALQHANAVAHQLANAGFSVAVDDDPRSTPGAKFYKWECLGVPIRIEIGAAEVSNQTCTVTFTNPTPAISHGSQLHHKGLSKPQPNGKPEKLLHVPRQDVENVCSQRLAGRVSGPKLGNCNKLHLWPNGHVCTSHVKHLVGMVGKCHCGTYHHTMQQLKDQVAETYCHGTGCQVERWMHDDVLEDATGHITLFVGTVREMSGIAYCMHAYTQRKNPVATL
jgi:hypothetical protein